MTNRAKKGKQNQTSSTSVSELTSTISRTLKQSYELLMDLSKRRAEEKLSSSGTVSIAKELKELIKIMDRYCN